MFDIGWSELLVIGVVALIVVGPKDLPKMFHQLGRFTAKAKSMAREFSSAMEDAAKDSGLDEAAGSVRDLKSLTSKKALGLDALERAADSFEKWDPKAPSARSKTAGLVPDPEAAPPKPASALAETATESVAKDTAAPAAKPAAKTGTARKPAAAKKPAAKKPAAKAASKSTTGKTTAAKPAAAKTTAAKSATAKKPAAKKAKAAKAAPKKDQA
ncbi:preprotein translocase subunit TatA [Thioclava dalianensis]|uniref:Sec-independent protein translocase protein TatB n=1 Tax=Thioclava dalianensis TaxID=1185766 RepID=A0A074TG72_9RHOB|nr:Sec-independent protein translocase protein TatB [Thioclava dalianensis]KEP70649.1 preprotein translocase subunit TatA [Thioclava dalianensis]SFN05760.1 sec-independent protein translocase protein TatB [Thioclava dalianensis]